MNSISRDDPRLRFVPIQQATDLKDGLVEIHLNRYWIEHPEKGLVFYKSNIESPGTPQCNKNRAIVEELRNKLYPWADIIFLPLIVRRIDPHDYI